MTDGTLAEATFGTLAEATLGGTQGQARVRRQQRQVQARERMAQALRLRLAGATYQAIADRLGYANRKGAQKACHTAIRDITSEPAQEVRELELARLDSMLLAISAQVSKGSLPAVDRALRIMERRARLLGLDAPQKIAPTDPSGENEWSGKSDVELIAEFEAIVQAARARAGAGSGSGD